jgi:hypothetical protein
MYDFDGDVAVDLGLVLSADSFRGNAPMGLVGISWILELGCLLGPRFIKSPAGSDPRPSKSSRSSGSPNELEEGRLSWVEVARLRARCKDSGSGDFSPGSDFSCPSDLFIAAISSLAAVPDI